MNVAQESPTQAWVADWVAYLMDMLPLIFLIVVVVGGIVLIARAGTGLGKILIFGVGAALAFLLVTNVETVSEFIGEELPIEGLPGPGSGGADLDTDAEIDTDAEVGSDGGEGGEADPDAG